MRIQLSEHFTYPKLLRFVFPSIIMMIFTSIYGVVDGLFVSNFVGKTPFAALNLIMPLLMILGALGFMIGTGGSAIVSKTLGEGKKEKANEYFSMLVYVTIVGGLILTVVGLIWIRPIAIAMGADDAMVGLRPVWKNSPGFPDCLYAPERFSELSDYCRKTASGPGGYRCRRGDKFFPGFSVYCRVPLGVGRRCNRNGN